MTNFQQFFRTLTVRKKVLPRWELLDRNNRKGDELITRDELIAEIAAVRGMIARLHDELVPIWTRLQALERQMRDWKEHLL